MTDFHESMRETLEAARQSQIAPPKQSDEADEVGAALDAAEAEAEAPKPRSRSRSRS